MCEGFRDGTASCKKVCRTFHSPTPQVVHWNSSCPSHSEQVGWQRTHCCFLSRNCPLGQDEDGLHPINPTLPRTTRNAATDRMAALSLSLSLHHPPPPRTFSWEREEGEEEGREGEEARGQSGGVCAEARSVRAAGAL